MKEEYEFILSGVALLVAAGLLSFGFGSLSGYSTKEQSSTVVTVTPDIVKAGNYIGVNIDADGKWGVNNRFNVCKRNLCYASGSLHCTGYGCRRKISVDYRIPSNLEQGDYYIRVKDMTTGEYVRGNFKIE